jgi:hypothetical protein
MVSCIGKCRSVKIGLWHLQNPRHAVSLIVLALWLHVPVSYCTPEPEFLNFSGAQESIPRKQFRQAVCVAWRARVGNLSPAPVGARNQVGIRLSYRPASLCSMATQFQTRVLELIPRPIAGLKFPTHYDTPIPTRFLAPIDCLKIPALKQN